MSLDPSNLEEILINQFKPTEYEKAELTPEQEAALEKEYEDYPEGRLEEEWMEEHHDAKRLLPLFAAYQSPKNLDMLRESLTGMVTFSAKGMEFLRSKPEVSNGFLPFAADYIGTIWTTSDETFMEVLNNSERLKTFSKNRPTNEQVPDGRPELYVHNYFSLGLKGSKESDIKELIIAMFKEALPEYYFHEMEPIMGFNPDKSHEEKLSVLNQALFPLGNYIENIGHALEKAEEAEEKGINNLVYRANIGLAHVQENENGETILRFFYGRKGDDIEDALLLKDWLTKKGIFVREEHNLSGDIRVGYSIPEQESKLLAAMSEEGRKLIAIREKAQEAFKNNEETRHYRICDAFSEKINYALIEGHSLKGLIKHSSEPSEQGINGGRILGFQIKYHNDTLLVYHKGEWKDSVAVKDFLQKDFDTLREAVIKEFS